ncbi:GNAT family N-acetyltransferase [Undibacterium sp. Ren11W]|uniref:GNAT family N-acetyltransferase n=1 Tax=Undibacterium sp. Ren11W TaxID=3413045 RepID=UPI003BF0F2A3
MYIISAEDPACPDAITLMAALSVRLSQITGDPGTSSFDADDVRGARALFVVARDAAGKPLGCAAFRPMTQQSAELKRMYAVPGTLGVGSAILAHIEQQALVLGYAELCLSTRRINQHALDFYAKHGYTAIPNFGKYADNRASVCLSKRLA